MPNTKRIDIDDPDVNMDAGQRLLYQGELFTGEVEERLGDRVISLDVYVDGVPDGIEREWYNDGTLRSEGLIRAGRAVGYCRAWHQNGTPVEEQLFNDGGFLVKERKWDEQGNLTRNGEVASRGPSTYE